MAELTQTQQAEVKKEVRKQVEKQVQIEEKRITKKILEKAKRPVIRITTEFRSQVSTAIVAAFGFLIAIAWKDLIVKLMEDVTPSNLLLAYPYLAALYSAIIVTVFAVLGILLVSSWAKKPEIQ